MVIVGIDLGTTCSCVAVWREGSVEVIPNDQGNRTTPSYVAFTESERLIGEAARNQSAVNPRNTIFGTKRLIGRRYDDIGVQMDLRHWPFKVHSENGKPMLSVTYKGEKKQFTPEEISGMILFRLKEFAEEYLGTKVDKAIITVPAYFNDTQRQATRAAGVIAGLDVLRVTNEPSAAALAYGLDKKVHNKNVLVYDLGGGTFDASIINVGKGPVYEVKATSGNTRLGGENFDNRLVAYFAEDFKNKYNIEITSNDRALRRLKSAAEVAKRFLSSATEATVQVDFLFNDIDYFGRITRALFEELCSDYFTDTIKHIEEVLTAAQLKKNDIHKVILVGGSTRIPKIQRMLHEHFKGKVCTALNPDEAVAHGAAIQAAMLNGDHSKNISDLVLVEVVPLSLGVETARGIMYKVIEKNTTVPCRQTKDLTTLEDYQNSMTIEIFEGERTLTKDNNLLGYFDLNGIPPAPRGVAKIDVTFDVDADGILSVTARDRSTGHSNGITIKNEARVSHQDIGRMIANAAAYREEDKENKRRLESRNLLESYVFNVKNTVNENSSKLSETEKRVMAKECQNAMEWLDANADCLREEYDMKTTELMAKWSVIMNKFYDDRLMHRAKRLRSENYQEITKIDTSANRGQPE